MRHKITTLIYLLAFCLSAAVAGPGCDVRKFSIKDGLASNLISAIDQDAGQLLWVGTWNGLCYFDGYGFSSVTGDLKYDMAVNNHLQNIRINSQNNIWCLTYDKRLYLYNTHSNVMTDVSAGIDRICGRHIRLRNIYPLKNGYTWVTLEGRSGKALRIDDRAAAGGKGIKVIDTRFSNPDITVHKVELDATGREWIFTSQGIEQYGGGLSVSRPYDFMQQAGKTLFFASKDGHMAVLRANSRRFTAIQLPPMVTHISCMADIGRGCIAAGTDAGVFVFDSGGRLLSVVPLTGRGQTSAFVTAMFPDSRGRLWIFTKGRGVTLMGAGGYDCRWLNAVAASPRTSTSSLKPLIVEDAGHTIWAVPAGGTFSYYDEKRHQLIPYILGNDGIKPEVPNIEKTFVDRQKNLWVFSTHDLIRINLTNRKISTIELEPNISVRSIRRNARGELLAGLHNGKLVTLSDDGRRTAVQLSPRGRIYAIYTDSRNRCWIGTKGDGLYLLENGRTRHFTQLDADRYSLYGNDVYDFYEDGRHRLWIGCFDKGLNLVDEGPGGNIRFINARNELKNYPGFTFCNKVRRIDGIKGKAIILTTAGGIVTFGETAARPADIRFNVFSGYRGNSEGLAGNTLMQALVARDGHIYLSTSAGGLAVSEGDPLSNRLTFRPVEDGQQRPGIILSMAEDADGRLWLTRENRLERYDTRTRQTVAFGRNDFGYDVSFTEARPLFDKTSGRMYMGTVNGLVTFNPAMLDKDNYRPAIVFTSVKYPNEESPRQILFTRELRVRSDQRNLTISFAALDYRDQSETQYAYKLDGIDDGWNYIGTRHSVSFNNLPHGHLRLLVKSTNADGVWSGSTAALNIWSEPTFWETVWAGILYGVIAIAVTGGVVYVILLRKKSQMEEEMNALRTSFYNEAGHKLRTPLTLIGGPAQEVLEGHHIDDRERGLLEMVLRNTRGMLDIVNKMLEHGYDRNYFVDDNTAPVFVESGHAAPEPESGTENGEERLRLLVVEDNDDLRHFLAAILSKKFAVLTAPDGKAGLDAAVKEVPDFIITDVNMPVMNGFEMINRIKKNTDTCHIPIIVLSAKASLDDKLRGLSEGVDDYITKPFSATYLEHRIDNIVAQRRMLQDALLDSLQQPAKDDSGRQPAGSTDKPEPGCKDIPAGVPMEESDRRMMERLMAYLDANLSNADMKVADLSAEMGMSRTVFYGKLKSITGMSPVDFVRYLRLQRAEHLVATTRMPLSEIAYGVGFSDPNYFGKCFKKAMGMSPSDYRTAKGNGGV